MSFESLVHRALPHNQGIMSPELYNEIIEYLCDCEPYSTECEVAQHFADSTNGGKNLVYADAIIHDVKNLARSKGVVV